MGSGTWHAWRQSGHVALHPGWREVRKYRSMQAAWNLWSQGVLMIASSSVVRQIGQSSSDGSHRSTMSSLFEEPVNADGGIPRLAPSNAGGGRGDTPRRNRDRAVVSRRWALDIDSSAGGAAGGVSSPSASSASVITCQSNHDVIEAGGSNRLSVLLMDGRRHGRRKSRESYEPPRKKLWKLTNKHDRLYGV